MSTAHCFLMIAHCGNLAYTAHDGMEKKKAMPSTMQSSSAMSSYFFAKPIFKSTPTQFQTIIYASSDTSNVGDHDGDMSEMNPTSKLHFSIYFPIGKLHFSIYFPIGKLHFSIYFTIGKLHFSI